MKDKKTTAILSICFVVPMLLSQDLSAQGLQAEIVTAQRIVAII